MTSLARRALVRNDRRYTTWRGNRQGRGLKERNSAWVLKETGIVGSLEMPLSSCFPQNPMVNGGLAHRTREVISSAFPWSCSCDMGEEMEPIKSRRILGV